MHPPMMTPPKHGLMTTPPPPEPPQPEAEPETGDQYPSELEPAVQSSSSYDLVEPMRYLFVRIVRVRGIRACDNPYVKVQAGPHKLRSRSGRDVFSTGNPEWNQVFAISHARPEPALEISVWDPDAPSPAEAFLGGVCFDLSDVPVRDNPDGPLARQYRLDCGEPGMVTGNIMMAVWIGTQADAAFQEACHADAPSKVYQSPKLWYLRASVIEAQDLRVPAPPPGLPFDVGIKIQLGFQSARTRQSVVSSSGSEFAFSEDLMFVASEPLDDSLIVLVEDRTMKQPALLGHTTIPVTTIEQRLNERQIVASRWFTLEGETSGIGMMRPDGPPAFYSGRLHLRLCLEDGYHVLDEVAHVCSNYRPTAKQPVGVLELGIIGACGLLPMKTMGGAERGSADAYCVAKYGKKWVRTRTITDSLNPRWNEQYTWHVYDPCTVLTVAVFDNWRMFAGAGNERQDYRIGKLRVRVSTLESNRAYTASYPLLLLLWLGLKKMGEVQLAVRFSSPAQLPDTWATYTTPLLPRAHYLRPIRVALKEVLRGAAVRTVATRLARSEPPLGPEVVRYMLDADKPALVWPPEQADNAPPLEAPRELPEMAVEVQQPAAQPPMRFLFIHVVRVRGIRVCEGPYVQILAGPHPLRSRPGRDVDGTGNADWNQVFAISYRRPEPTLEISVWDGDAPSHAEAFLGGVCFDLSDVPVRDQLDGPLAPQYWYRLEGGEPGMATGDIMVAVWIGTDDPFPA